MSQRERSVAPCARTITFNRSDPNGAPLAMTQSSLPVIKDVLAISNAHSIGGGVISVSLLDPGGDLIGDRLFVGNASIEALRGEDAELGFGQVEPGAVFGGEYHAAASISFSSHRPPKPP